MDRHIEKDEFGGKIEYKMTEVKKCPICRCVVLYNDIDHVNKTFLSNPNFDD